MRVFGKEGIEEKRYVFGVDLEGGVSEVGEVHDDRWRLG
jgi:hypothetical protein